MKHISVPMELYRTFHVVAQQGSISKAAETLFISQPAVSRSIRQLEDKSGCALFFRTPKGVKLTKEGETLHQYIEQAFNFVRLGEKRLAEVQQVERGEVTIGVSDTLCKHYLLPHLKLFNQSHPGVHLHVANQTTPVIIDMLKKGSIDIGMVNLPVQDSSLAIENIMEIQDCFVVGQRYKELSQKVRSIEEVVRYPILLLHQESNSRLYIDKYLRDHHIDIKPEIVLGNFELLVQFALYDFGVACVIKNFILTELEDENLYEIKLTSPIPPRHVGVIHLKSLPLSAASRKLMSFLLP